MHRPPLSPSSMAAAAALAVLMVSCPACSDVADPVSNTSNDTGPALAPVSGVAAQLSLLPWSDGLQAVELRLAGERREFASYAGQIRFRDGVPTIRESRLPVSDHHFSNSIDGEIRVAGFAVEGFRDPVALRFLLEAPRPLSVGDLVFELDVVGDPVGERVNESRIHVSSTTTDGGRR